MIEIKVVGLNEVINTVAGLYKQGNYAASIALNETAKVIQAKEIDLLQSRFTLRKTWYKPKTKYGINIQYAKKDNLEARVFSKAPWLSEQEKGGIRNKQAGKYNPIEVPAKNIQQNKSRLVPKRLSIGTIKNNPIPARAFQIKGNWWRRTSKTKIEPLFFKEKTINLKAKYPFTDTGKETFNNEHERQFNKAFEYAMRTAK